MQIGSYRLIAHIVMLMLLPFAALAQATGSGGAPATQADVIIFVSPVTQDSARIGVAYRTRIAHKIVLDDLNRLLTRSGWMAASNPFISDASVHPDRLDQYPVTTAAELLLIHAPQFRGEYPDLVPYLTAFQRVDHLEVNFVDTSNRPLQQVQHVSNSAFDVDLQAGEGLYRYEASTHQHAGELPELSFGLVTAATAPPAAVGGIKNIPNRGTTNLWSIVLIVAGCGLIGCACAYTMFQRRTFGRVPTHSVSRR